MLENITVRRTNVNVPERWKNIPELLKDASNLLECNDQDPCVRCDLAGHQRQDTKKTISG